MEGTFFVREWCLDGLVNRLSGWTVAVTIIRPVYVGLQAPFRQVRGQQRAEITSQWIYLSVAAVPWPPSMYEDVVYTRICMLFAVDAINMEKCNLYCDRSYMCLLLRIQRLNTGFLCRPFLASGSPWGKCLYVSDSSSHFAEVTVWVWLGRLLKWWLLDAESCRHMWAPAGALTIWEMVPRCSLRQNLTT